MLETFNTRLLSNLPDLRERKGNIGCPCAHLNLVGQPRLECHHICGILFPQWELESNFYDDGRKHGTGNCPCVKCGKLFTKNAFWEYIDKMLIAKGAQCNHGRISDD